MALYTWRNLSGGAGGAFDIAGDWTNPTESVSTTVPTYGDTANLNAGGGAIGGSGSVDTIAFAVASWTIIGQLTATTVSVTGQLNAISNGAQLVVNGAMQVGLAGSAALTVANGGSINVTAGPSGPTSLFGAASLTVLPNGLAGFGNLSLGVGGAASAATVNMAVLTVGGILQLGSSAGPTTSLGLINGGIAVLSAAVDTTTPYLEVGAADGASAALTVDGANSILLISNNSGAIGYRGTGTLTVTGGASARFNASANASNNALNPALTIGRYGVGTVTVSGPGSLVAAGGSVIVGVSGPGILRIQNGASITSTGFVPTQAALAVGTATGGSGMVTIDGSGSSLTASGVTIVGGDNRGSGLTGGGTGAIAVTNGGALQTRDTMILAGSSVSLDRTSLLAINGNATVAGTLSSAGTLVISGALFGGGQVSLGGGVADIGGLGAAGFSAATLSFTSAAATVRLHSVAGLNTVASMQQGDAIDLLGNTSVRLAGTVVTTTTGSISLSAAPTGSHYVLDSDGAGGTIVALTADTIGVYRFFDSNYGTHFFTASTSELTTIEATRPDLVYEGVGLQSISPAANDPNASPIYRFFDTNYGTHFFTASASERDTVIATRPDLTFEGTGFLEHNAQQVGDTPVYRFFDTTYGTHFYTADAGERATILATRPDLVDEGAGFYAPTA